MPRARAPPRSPSPSSSSSRTRSPTPSPSPSRPKPAANPTSTLVHHSIPPFYACYLLRSFAARPGRAGQTYIGSTPDPPRRWRQHMGLVKGGAFKTRLGRPWEMELVVHGFPTKLQALQFEWAWQNPHASRLLRQAPVPQAPATATAGAHEEAATRARVRAGRGRGTGEGQEEDGGDDGGGGGKKVKAAAPAAATAAPQFPRTLLSNRPLSKVQVLQFMLTSAPWRAFPLRVTLLSLDARAWWDAARRLGPVVRTEAAARRFERERERESEGERERDAWGERGKRLDEVRVEVRREGVDGARLVRDGERKEGDEVERMRVDDGDFFDAHWAKWTTLVDDPDALREPKCDLCRREVDLSDHLAFHLCTASDPAALAPCLALFHPVCLATHLLSPPPTTSTTPTPTPTTLTSSSAPTALLAPPLLPTKGACPACGGAVHWAELVRGSYRRRDEAEGKRKKRTRQRGGAAVGAGAVVGGGPGTKGRARATGRGKGEGKGKGRARAAGRAEESDVDDELATFRFAGSGEDDSSSGAGSVDLALDDDHDDESDAERSFARLDAAAQEALGEGDEVRAPWDDDDDDDEGEASALGPSAFRRPQRARSSPRRDLGRSSPAPSPTPSPPPPPPPPPVPPKKRGRPPKTRPAPSPAPYSAPGDIPLDLDLDLGPLAPARSPWDDLVDVLPSLARKTRAPRLHAVAAPAPAALPKKRGRPPKAAAAPPSLVAAGSGFGTTKAQLSSSRRAREDGGAREKGEAGALEEAEEEKGRARRTRGPNGAKKRHAYIELSD
ncbi:hypothetical protein JCM3775_000695 [Rhodotorula graminis]